MLADYLRYRYPDARPSEDYQLRDDGDGPFIEHWNEALGPMPTQADIDAAAPQVAKFVAATQIEAQIDALQQKSLLNRGSRELEIVSMQDLARRKVNAYLEANPDDTTPVADLILHELETTPYWVKLTELNAQLAALMEQL